MNTHEALLKAVLATVARQTFPPIELAKLITANNGGMKQILAYNLCDGQTPQKEICKRAGLDQGSLSRSIARWIELGIAIRLGEHPMHLYPVPKEHAKAKTKK